MKLLIAGDLHLRNSAPKLRTDNFFATQEKKLDFIIQIANKNKCDVIVFPGDIFHRYDSTHSLVEWAIHKFKTFRGKYYFVFGNHDLKYHKYKDNTALGVLVAGLGYQTQLLNNNVAVHANVNIYGCDYNDQIPVPFPPLQTHSILVLHKYVANTLPHWATEEMITTKSLRKQNPAFNFFICGDNHSEVLDLKTKQKVINLGSVMRTSIAQIDHKPRIAILELGRVDHKLSFIKIPIEQVVFDEKVIAEEKQNIKDKEAKLKQYALSLQKDLDVTLSFVDNLKIAMQNSSKELKQLIDEVLEKEE